MSEISRTVSLSHLFICLVLVLVLLIMFTNNLIMRETGQEVAFFGKVNLATIHTSLLVRTRTNTNLESFKRGIIFQNHRLRLWYGGRCIDSSDGETLTVQFCDPNTQQAFSLTTDGRLIYERTGKCVDYTILNDTMMKLGLSDCSEVLPKFIAAKIDGEFYIRHIVNNKELCATPMERFNDFNITTNPCLEDPIGLTFCDKEASRILPMEESFFQQDRKLLKNLTVSPNSSCDFKGCEFNRREPVKLLPPEQVSRCTNLWECVTLTVKTTRRPHLIVRLAKSVRDTFGYDLPIVAYDDGPNDYSEEIRNQIAEYPLLQYIVSENEDLGISRGRNLAMKQVKTKYLFLLDDDIKFFKDSDLRKLVEILDTTDAAVAAGSYMGRIHFTGYFHFGYFNQNKDRRRLGLFHQACTLVNQTIPNHPDCVRCEISSNVFLARTKEMLDIGGWDSELMIVEHKDVFIRLKAAGMKVALCPDVKFNHARPSKIEVKGADYKDKRRRGGLRFRILTANRWNVHSIFETGASYGMRINPNNKSDIEYRDQPVRGFC